MNAHGDLRHSSGRTEGRIVVPDLVRRRGAHYRPARRHAGGLRGGAFLLAFALLVGYLPALSGTASSAEGDPVVTRQDKTNGCNGVLPTPGSENTTKRLDPDYPSDLSPGGTVGYIIDFPVDAADVSGRSTFVITDCVFVDGVAVARYEVSFVPNTEAYELRFAIPVPAETALGAEFCNYAKTTAAPSTSQASNRKAGPACFTVGGDLRIEKRSGSVTGPLLPGASFAVVCAPTASLPPTIITGLSSPSTTGPGGVVSASGTSASGTIAIVGPSGTPCRVTETAAPTGFVGDPATRSLVIPVGSGQVVEVFVNRQRSSLSVIKRTSAGSTGTFTFRVDCDGTEFDRTFTIDTNGTRTFDEIPVGTTCAVTEDADTRFSTTVTPSTGSVVIDADGESVTFDNTRRLGTLTVAKTTNGGTGTFVFDVDCGGVRTVVEIVDSGTGTVRDIPTGTVCAVTERSHPDFTSTVSPADGRVTIDEDGERVAFTNTRTTGTLVIDKTTTGGTGTFTFTVDCDGTAFDRSVSIDGSGSATVVGIPTGTTCTVTEAAHAEFTSTVSPADGTVRIVTGANTVRFTNTAKPAGLSVTKTADAAEVVSGDAIGFTVRVTSTGTGTARAVSLTDPLPAATGVSWSISPAYTGPGTCEITGAAPNQTLGCAFGDLAPGAAASVHVASATTAATAGRLDNTATVRAGNVPDTTASATVTVTPAVVLGVTTERPAPAAVLALVPPAPAAAPAAAPASAAATAPATLPRTGSPLTGPLQAALSLLVIGGLALVPNHLRRRRFAVVPLER